MDQSCTYQRQRHSPQRRWLWNLTSSDQRKRKTKAIECARQLSHKMLLDICNDSPRSESWRRASKKPLTPNPLWPKSTQCGTSWTWRLVEWTRSGDAEAQAARKSSADSAVSKITCAFTELTNPTSVSSVARSGPRRATEIVTCRMQRVSKRSLTS